MSDSQFFDSRVERKRIFEAIQDSVDVIMLAIFDPEAVQEALYKSGHKRKAYFIERQFFAGKREPDAFGWPEFKAEFRRYQRCEEDHKFISKIGLENLGHDEGSY